MAPPYNGMPPGLEKDRHSDTGCNRTRQGIVPGEVCPSHSKEASRTVPFIETGK